MKTEDKFKKLIDSLHHMEKVMIAYSGGVDSTFLLKAASLSGLQDILAVTGASKSFPKKELDFSRQMASALNVRHHIIYTEEMTDENYFKNPPDRCYYCKKELFGKLRKIAEEDHFLFILDGTNTDDEEDWRPGRRAASENGIHSPLRDTGLSKNEIREISKSLGLPTWNKPATPCLASRFPYGDKITIAGLERVEQSEDFIRRFGFKDVRVRNHSGTARIEILSDDFQIMMDEKVRPRIISYLNSLGYKYVTLDLQGFRSGSMNESISGEDALRNSQKKEAAE